MAKGIGLIGNFSGKVGNTVGYQITASNNGQTQGVRVYQPNVKNPKTAAQAEQRAKLAPINALYRVLKNVIDRGNEGLPYGNKSRLAWLKNAFNVQHMAWIEKGVVCQYPIDCHLTKGSLTVPYYSVNEDTITLQADGIESSTPVATIGALSTALLACIPSLKSGDQVTFVTVGGNNGALISDVFSFVIDTTSAEANSRITASTDNITYESPVINGCGAVIISREGANGEHLRSNSILNIDPTMVATAPYDATSKTAAIKSYMKQAGAEGDWAEESLQD